MNPAACSWRVTINWMLERDKASRSCRFSSPGMPKTYLTPSFSKALTNSSEAFIGRRPGDSGRGSAARDPVDEDGNQPEVALEKRFALVKGHSALFVPAGEQGG